MEPRSPENDDTVDAAAAGAAEVTALATATEGDAPVLAARYRLLALLGTGGMGSVYRVRDLELDEIVALKMLRRELVAAPGALGRFRQEVKLARRVTHKNVARTFDIGEHENEKFLTMEYVDGASLAVVIAEDRPSIRRALEISRFIAEGLAAAHEAGVIHRDLKPDNVLVEHTGRVVVTDFGIARLGGGGDRGNAQEWLGTPAYMAPEQVEGRTDLDARCDLYAVGEVLYELLTGQPAWTGQSAIVCASARLIRPPPNPCALRTDLPAPVGELVVRLLAQKREDRFASARDVIAALTLVTPRTATGTKASMLPGPTHGQRGRDVAVAVLPFRNGSPADDYLSDGFGDDLLDILSTTPALRVRPRSMVMRFKGKEVDPREVGRELSVDVVVDGSMRRVGADAFRLTIRLLSVADGFQLWAQPFDAKLGDLLVVSDAAARAIGDALAAHIGAPPRKVAKDPVAIDLYLRAREELNRRAYGTDVDDAIALLEDALRREPDEPNILAAYAVARSRISQSAASVLLAVESAERATTLAPNLGEGWLALASVRLMQGDFASTVGACARALGCSPHLAKAHHLLGDVMYPIGWTRAAIHRSTLALSLEPQLRGPAITLAMIHGLMGDYDKAEAMLLDPSLSDPPVSFIAAGTRSRLAMWRGAPPPAEPLPDLDLPALRFARFFQKVALTRSVDDDDVAKMRSSLPPPGAMIASFMGQIEAEAWGLANAPDRALDAIDLAVRHGLIDLLWMDRVPLLGAARRLPRFQELRAPVEARAVALRRTLVLEGYAP